VALKATELKPDCVLSRREQREDVVAVLSSLFPIDNCPLIPPPPIPMYGLNRDSGKNVATALTINGICQKCPSVGPNPDTVSISL
jgi:hypothetical protein